MVASLATAIMAVVRAQLMSTHGMPLGLLSSPFRFNEMAYFWSPAFLFGTMSVTRRPREIGMVILLLGCGLLAAVVGPSTALLIIPYTENNWPAGGTDFWLIGSDDTLWPDHLNASHAGGTACLNPDDTQVTTAPLNMSSCLWAGYTQLAEGLKNRHFDWQSNITFNDGVVKRQFTRHQAGSDIPYVKAPKGEKAVEVGDAWVLGTHVPTARISRLIADERALACKIGSSTKRLGSKSNFKNATDGLGTAKVDSWLPFSRVSCQFREKYEISLTRAFKQGLGVSESEGNGLKRQGLLNLMLTNPKFSFLPEFAPRLSYPHLWQATAELGRSFEGKKVATHWIDIPPPETRNHPAAWMDHSCIHVFFCRPRQFHGIGARRLGQCITHSRKHDRNADRRWYVSHGAC